MDKEERLGLKLTECFSDKTRIAIQTCWRTALCLAFDIGNFGGIAAIRNWGEVPPDMRILLVNVVLTVVLGLFPLIHLREYMAFHQYGIVYRRKAYLWSELGDVGWRDHTYGGLFRSILMDTDKKTFDVTYVNGARKQYNRAYMKN